MVLAIAAIPPAWAQTSADKQQAAEMAFDQYAAAKNEDQRVAVIDYLQHLDRKTVAAALIDHILASRTGAEATVYNQLIEALNPDGCAALLERLGKAAGPSARGKLIVALRHCQSPDAIQAVAGFLDDKRPVPFEAHGPHPRRVCDLAYDELYLKLRSDPRYNLDPSPRMIGIIVEKTPGKTRDALIAKMKEQLAAIPLPSPSPAPAAQ
jgi:hypothetical protein